MARWQPIETAPRDGTRMLWGGRFRAFDKNPGGQWTEEIFSWGTILSNRTHYQWLSSTIYPPEHWNVDWTHWTPLPKPPNEGMNENIRDGGSGVPGEPRS
jgi:hypothetical protein